MVRRIFVAIFCFCFFITVVSAGVRFTSDLRIRLIKKGIAGWLLKGEVSGRIFSNGYIIAGSIWLPDRSNIANIHNGVCLITPRFTCIAENAIFDKRKGMLTFSSGSIYNGSSISGLTLSNIRFNGSGLTFLSNSSEIRLSCIGFQKGVSH